MTTKDSYFSHRLPLSLRMISVLILAGCALLLGLRVQVNYPKTFAPSNPLPELQGQAAVERLKQEGLYDTLAEAVTAARYHADALPSPDTYQFSNPAQSLRATFTSSGARVVSSPGGRDRELTFKLIGYGYGSRITNLDSRHIVARHNRIEHEYSLQKQSEIQNPKSEIVEWFVNSEAGIEHGFTLPESPPVERGVDEALRVEMEIGGDFEPRLDATGQTMSFACGRGGGGLTYNKLRVYDALKREMAARFELEGKRLAIVMEDGEAEYPVTIDPLIAQEAKLTASDGAASDEFGGSVAISGDTVVVGAPRKTIDGGFALGAAYVFVSSGTTWTQQQKITAAGVDDFGLFGSSVAIDGDTVVVGSPASPWDYGGSAAYVFVRSRTTWTLQQPIFSGSQEFGFSVAIDGDTVVVGSPFDNMGGPNWGHGAANVFTRSGSTWSEQRQLRPNDSSYFDQFGSSVAIDGNTVVVGAPAVGAAYIFARSGPTWSEQQKLVASDGAASIGFGESVAIGAGTVVVGASGVDTARGAAYIFARSETTWTQQQKITASDGGPGDNFGASVAIGADTLVVGAPGADIDRSANQGAVYVFARSETTWTQQQKITASDGSGNDSFGASIAFIVNTVVVGAPRDNSAYVVLTPFTPGAFGTVSAASFMSPVAEKEIVAGFGVSLATTIAFATSTPLPTSLAGTSVRVKDSAGVERDAPLYFISPTQINYQIPDGTAPGAVTISVFINSGLVAVGSAQIEEFAPSIFTLDASGSGPAVALDALTFERAPFKARRDGGLPNIIAVWGTGLGADATDVDGNFAASVLASIGGRSALVTYAGRAPFFQGANQFNIQLPDGIPSGEHTLMISRGGAPSNVVTIAIR